MKKIIIGITILTISPFVVLFGAWIIGHFNINSNANTFAFSLGAFTVLINYSIGILLIIQGSIEVKY